MDDVTLDRRKERESEPLAEDDITRGGELAEGDESDGELADTEGRL